MKRVIYIFLLSLSSISVFALGDKDKSEGKSNVKTAEKALEVGDKYQAIDIYEKILLKNNDIATAYKLGMLYFDIRDYKNAERCFELASKESMINPQPLAAYYFALMQKMNGKYAEAKKTFETFKKSLKSDIPGFNKKWVDIEIEGCVMALNKTNESANVIVKHPGRELNSSTAELSPLQWDDHTIIFASNQSDTVITKNKTNNHMLHFYKANVTDNSYTTAALFESFNVNDKEVKNGCFSSDKKRFYYNVCGEDKENNSICAIYVSELKDGTWSPGTKLPDAINLPKFTALQPCIGTYRDGKEVLYFVSNRPEGKGALDIWYATLDKAGTFGEVKNAGSKLNTDRDEVTPAFDFNSKTMYFSSDGRKNFGGYDIYSSVGSLSSWSVPENMGTPINSSTNDMWFQPNSISKKGYFVSNRPGILSVKSETCCPDIFSYEFIKVINIAVRGKVYDNSDGKKDELSGAKVTLSIYDEEAKEYVPITELVTEKPKSYFSMLQLDKQYKVTAAKQGYLSSNITFNTNGITESDTLVKNLNLSKIDKNKAYRLNNIYYDFDKWNLREESKKTLDSLYTILVENPQIIIELGSHTDSRGSDEYNQDLSQKRAQSCVDYLISRGIEKNRITPKGYGESAPLEDCSKKPECPTSSSGDCDCHQLNRRTEFKIIGELDGVLQYDDKRIIDK
ncbi:MAG: OmpA family protein [Bacteroidota bacterium]